jgi:hypothetical protein
MGSGPSARNGVLTEIASMENRLSGILQPVPPRKEFVRALSSHIQREDPETLIDQIKGWPVLAIVAAGLVSLAVLLAVGARALILLTRRRHLLKG